MNNRVTAASQKDNNRPQQPSILRDWSDGDNGFLDTTDFALYCLEVKRVIKTIGQPCIAEIKRAIPDNEHRYLFDAIESLEFYPGYQAS